MHEHQLQIVDEAMKTVNEIFKNKVNPLFVFHNLDHTQQVVNAATDIAEYYHLDDNDRFVLFVSAWFHDTGFSGQKAEDHEKESIRLACDFLQNRHADQEEILRISSCIQATHLPQTPLNQVEKIICDADLYHLGTDMFNKMNDRLRQEIQAYFKSDFPKEEWRQLNVNFLKSHKYFTGYCQQKNEPLKQEWIKQLQKKQETMV